jgi:hypothetical protein
MNGDSLLTNLLFTTNREFLQFFLDETQSEEVPDGKIWSTGRMSDFGERPLCFSPVTVCSAWQIEASECDADFIQGTFLACREC